LGITFTAARGRNDGSLRAHTHRRSAAIHHDGIRTCPTAADSRRQTSWSRTFGWQALNEKDVSLRHEFHGSCVNHMRNGEASHADANGALDGAVKAKLDKPTRLQRVQLLLPSRRHDEIRDNQWRFPPSVTSIHTVQPSSRQQLLTHGPPRPLHQDFQTSPRHVLLLQP
jgi:hypothetical protein